ncbi:MAG: isopentenyl-diphosphate Delta-isomerase [Flammeovirgaceae bacterium]|nr:isopentenyl-diphosphate Delta-isomerase [Flammeovirgaceae bacterium]
MDKVILVDEQDNAVGIMEKLEAHRKGILHRAFSVLLFNSRGELLLQQRADSKYHSGGLWTNTCCSHPIPDEPVSLTVRKKLNQEMGIDLQPEFSYSFIYKSVLNNGMIEHELDHVYTGKFDGEPKINHEEVKDWRFVNLDDLKKEINKEPEKFTSWFKIMMNNQALRINRIFEI